MRLRLPNTTFRTRVILVAFLLVAIQLATAIPLLGSIREEQRSQAEEQLELAGAAYSEYMQNRLTTMTSIADVLVKDFPIREAVVLQDPTGIEDALANLAERGDFDDAAAFDLSGRFLGGIGAQAALEDARALAHFAADPGANVPFYSIAIVDGRLYQTISVPVREPITAPEANAWLTLGFQISDTFAEDIAAVIGYEATFVRFDLGTTEIYATTLDGDAAASALTGVFLGADRSARQSFWGEEYITELRPVRPELSGLFVAIQRPVQQAMRAYFALRDVFLIIFGLALLATMVAAFWLSRTVTRPIGRLVVAAERMAEGIYTQRIDVQSKDEFAVLASGFNAMQEAIAQRERDIVHMAHHDSLSGLPTREIILTATSQAIEEHDKLAVVNFVLHRFDELAATLGQATAERLIQRVAECLRDRLEPGQILGHLNHQEFVLVLPDAATAAAESCALTIQSTLRSGLTVDDARIALQIRAGAASYPNDADNATELLRRASIARSHANHHLGSCGKFDKHQEDASLERIQIVSEFPQALRNGDLRVAYQPKIDCETLELCGAEALVRWQHERRGLVSPDVFIGAIEQAGGISQLTRWVLEEAAQMLVVWRSHGLGGSIAVNVSASDLGDDYLPGFLVGLGNRYEFEPKNLTLEVTESAIMRDVSHSLSIVSALRQHGFRIAIDDFGTGHSSLAQLKRFPVDELKIDKSFVLNISDPRDEAVVRTAIDLAHQFGLTTVAEGVENEVCLARLRHLGCETVQGFFFSEPIKSDDFIRWAKSWANCGGRDLLALIEGSVESRRA